MIKNTNDIHLAGLRETGMEPSPPLSMRRAQWEHIQRVLSDCNGNISAAARALGIDRRTLQRKLRKQLSRG